MISNKFVFKLASVLLIAVFFSGCKEEDKAPEPKDEGETVENFQCNEKKSFAVVELFTSQGCSSCPSVDALINSYVKADTGKNIVYIANHIDYWNGALPGPCGYSAWEDRYSDAKFTERQRAYRTQLGYPGLITPQLIFSAEIGTYNNGSGTVPYQSAAIRSKIDEQYNRAAEVGVAIQPSNYDLTTSNLKVEYATLDAPENCKLVLWLLEGNLSDKITSGENCNKTLSHENVARSFVEIQNPDKHGFAELHVPGEVKLKNARVAVFIANSSTLEIIAADTGFPFPK